MQTVGELVQSVRALIGGLHAPLGVDHFPVTFGWSFGNVNGFETLIVEYTTGVSPQEFIVYFSVRELPDGWTMPAEQMIRETGFCGGASYSLGQESVINPTWSDLCDEVMNWVVQLKAELVSEWSNGSIMISIDEQKTLFLGNAGVACQVMLFETAGDIIPCWEQWQAIYNYRISPEAASETPIAPMIPQGTVVVIPAPQNSELVSAVKDIALADTSVSINNSSVMFGIKTRAVTEEGP